MLALITLHSYLLFVVYVQSPHPVFIVRIWHGSVLQKWFVVADKDVG